MLFIKGWKKRIGSSIVPLSFLDIDNNMYVKYNTDIHVNLTRGLHYENTPINYTVIFHGFKNDYSQIKKFDIFSYFC